MISDSLAGRWHELKGEMRARWGRITEREWADAEGDDERLCELLMHHYGMTRQQAEAAVDPYIVPAASIRATPIRGVDREDPSIEVTDNSVRAHPGDVLGLRSEGETTALGETKEDEDERRVDAERAVRAAGRD